MFSIRIKRNNKFEVHKSKNPEFTVGRASDCDIVIHSDVISRHHLKIALTPEEIFVMDLKSANGTFKNGQRLEANKPYVIKDEDSIRLGNMPDEIQIHDIRPGLEKVLKQPVSAVKEEDPPSTTEKEEAARQAAPTAKQAPSIKTEVKTSTHVQQSRRAPQDLKITAVPPVLSLQAVSKKVETILDNAKKKARDIINSAEQDAEKTITKAVENAENIIRDAKEQAAKIVINGEESTKVIIQKAKIDADVIIEKANAQAKQTVEKSVMEAELAVAEGRRKGESLVSAELLEIENQKIKLKQIWLEEEKKLWAEFHRKKEEEFNQHKHLIFEEKEKVRKEIDEKKAQFAKELVKRQDTLKSEEAQFINKKLLLQDEIEKLQKKEEQQKNEFAQKSLSLKKKYESEETAFKRKFEEDSKALRDRFAEEVAVLKDKEEKLKNEFSQKSYALQAQFEEEKSKSELTLSTLKKKYDEEIIDYKKKEMDRINSYLKQEQDALLENKKFQSYQTRYSLKKAVAGALGNELHKVLDKEQLSLLLDKVSIEIDKTTSELDESQKQEAQTIGVPTVKTMEKRNSKVSAVVGLSLSIVVLGAFIFWDAIYDSMKNSESYSKFMFDKMQIESVYVPIQGDEWKSTYYERVLYLKDYVDLKTNQLYIDKWTQHLTNVENARSLKVTEDEMIQFLAREINLVNQLASLQKTIDARQLDLGLAKLRIAEEEANVDFVRILKSKESLLKVAEWEKQFVSEHMNRMRQQRLPSETK